jgi:hypothetical protein
VDVDPEDETRLTDGGREVVTGEADWTGLALRRFMVIVGQCNHGQQHTCGYEEQQYRLESVHYVPITNVYAVTFI